MNRRILQFVVAIVSPVMFGWFADASWAQGGPITQGPVTDLWNTGVSNSGVVLPNGTNTDPHYTLTMVPSGSSNTIVTATSAAGSPPIPPWLPDDSQSDWIGPGLSYNGTTWQLQSPAVTTYGGVPYDYETTFMLSTAGSYTITGQWSADGHGYDILLDGGATGNSTLPSTDYAYWTPFSISGTGAAGSHTLDFLVDKNTTGTLMTGLRVEFTPTPEPSTLVLLSIGGVGLLSCVWRRRRGKGKNMKPRTNFIIASAGVLLVLACMTPSAEANLLVNPGFESGPGSLTTTAAVLNNPFTTGQWGADNGTIEPGPDLGITPNSGFYMLAERHSSGPYTSTYQVVNVPYFPGEQVTLSAWFDAPAVISGTAEADVFLSCYASVNSWPTPLAPPVGQSLILSAAPVWQQMSPLTITVPAGTNYIVADVGFLNTTLYDQNTGVTLPGFVDDASLTVTPEPSSLVLLLGAGAIGLLSYAWRRRKPIGRPERLSLQQAASLAITFFPTHTLLKTRRIQVNRRILQFVVALVSPVMFGWFADASWAQINQGPVMGLWNTGLSSSGSLLPDGTVPDPHYSLVSAPSGSSIALVTATSAGGPPVSPYGPWLPDDSQSDWIGPSQYAASPSPLQYPSMIGNYDFQTSFFLSSPATVTISGQWSADGLGYDILLDNQSTGAFTLPGTTPYPTDSSYWTPFSITGTGVAGSNTLDFLVDQPYAPNGVAAYTGLRVEFTPAPEPSTLVLLGVGAIGLLSCAWRRRKRIGGLMAKKSR